MKTLLIADDEQSIQLILKDTLKSLDLNIVCVDNGEAALDALQNQNIDIAILDIRMPKVSGLEILEQKKTFKTKTQCLVITAQDTMDNAVTAMKHGAFDYLTKPFDIDDVKALVMDAANNIGVDTEKNKFLKAPKQTLIGNTSAMREIFKTIGRVAQKNVTVLIQGESGTGKELLAKAIHQNSPRANKPFVAVNCSAIPHEILESELFGHKKGSFTGAIENKLGYFEQAQNGTIFLDEIGEMPLILQTKILRFLQDHTIQKVGSFESKALDVRVVAATNRDLKQEIIKGRFREDLFFRLNVVPISVPPLRERKTDIPRLIHYFLNKHSNDLMMEAKELSQDALAYLISRKWPGNVRELENVIRRLIVLSRGSQITKTEVLDILRVDTLQKDRSLENLIEERLRLMLENLNDPQNLYEKILPDFEKPLIRLALQKAEGNQIKAAEILGIHRNTLRKKIKDLEI